MKKKRKEIPPNDTTFKFRCREADLEEFKRCADAEGFRTVTAWLLWHLRRIAKASRNDGG